MSTPLKLLLRIPVPWVFVLTYLVGVVLEHAWPSPLTIKGMPDAGAAGAVVFAIGLAIAGWGWGTFRKARTTTVPGRTSAALVTWGPYRFSRNPMYVGLALMYLGEAGMLRQAWPVALLPLVFVYVNWVVIPVEERRLAETFGEEYERFRAGRRRWL